MLRSRSESQSMFFLFCATLQDGLSTQKKKTRKKKNQVRIAKSCHTMYLNPVSPSVFSAIEAYGVAAEVPHPSTVPVVWPRSHPYADGNFSLLHHPLDYRQACCTCVRSSPNRSKRPSNQTLLLRQVCTVSSCPRSSSRERRETIWKGGEEWHGYPNCA